MKPYEVKVDSAREKRLFVNVVGHGGRIEVWWTRGEPAPLYDSQLNDDQGRTAPTLHCVRQALFIVEKLLLSWEKNPPWNYPVIATLPLELTDPDAESPV